ncbi:MAG: MurR/RpiR family transcriptional regulator [Thermomicrobiales bacterium]|nr:MurR/RpiR family transcriptional regulator [Thermomicrobiales bacterium]
MDKTVLKIDATKLSPKQQKVVSFIVNNPSFAAFASSHEIARRAGVSPATVVRLAQTLEFDGYDDFQQSVRHQYLSTLRPFEALESRSRDGQNVLQAQISQDVQNLQRLGQLTDLTDVQRTAEAIDRARQVVILAEGSYSAPALLLSHLLRFMGYTAINEDRGGPHLTAAIAPLRSDDLLIGITFWRGVREIAQMIHWARERGIPTLALTDSAYTSLAEAAEERVVIPTEGVSFFQSMVAPISFVYAVVAYLAEHASEERKSIMLEAEKTYDLINL